MNAQLPTTILCLAFGLSGAVAEWDFSSLLMRTCSFDRLYEPPGHRANMASSYDRQLMNADAGGFIREENGRYLMADIPGPGAVVRLWSANPQGRIWIYLDDARVPLIEEDFRDLFLGKRPPFVEPFVCVQHKELTNCYHWAYVPLPFAKSCRIYLDKVGFFQATYVQFPPNTKVETLTLPLAQRHREAMERLAPQFAAVGSPPSSMHGDKRKLEGSVQPGQTARLATLKGPAVIRALRLKWPELDPQTGRTARLSMTWDGEATPSVRVPLADFFGSGFKTLVLGVGENETGYCYFPMPFQKSAEISVANEGKELLKFSGELVVEQDVELPSPLRTFHALWRRDLETRPAATRSQNLRLVNAVCDPQHNYLVADIRGRGHYVATMLHRNGRSEGDEYVFVDGEPPPGSSPGTGNEDYFNMAWGPKTMDGPLAGGKPAMGIAGCFRVHLPDAISFEKSLRFTFEVLCGNNARYDYDTTGYWYQEEPHAAFPALLPAPARKFRTLPHPPDPAYVYTPDAKATGWWSGQPVLPPEGEDLQVVRFDGPRPAPVDMLVEGPDWSGGKQLLQRAEGPGASFTVKLPPVDSDGWQTLTLRWTTGPEYGRVRLRSNRPSELRSVECHAPLRGARAVLVGAVQRTRGDEAELTVEVVGKDKAAASAWVGIDWLMQEPTIQAMTDIQVKPAALSEANWQPCPKLPPPTPEQAAEAKRRRRELPPPEALEPAALSGTAQEYLFRTRVQLPADGLYRLDYRVGWATVPANVTVNGKEITIDPRRFANPALPKEHPRRYYVPLKAGDNELTWRARLGPKQWIAPSLMGTSRLSEAVFGAQGIED